MRSEVHTHKHYRKFEFRKCISEFEPWSFQRFLSSFNFIQTKKSGNKALISTFLCFVLLLLSFPLTAPWHPPPAEATVICYSMSRTNISTYLPTNASRTSRHLCIPTSRQNVTPSTYTDILSSVNIVFSGLHVPEMLSVPHRSPHFVHASQRFMSHPHAHNLQLLMSFPRIFHLMLVSLVMSAYTTVMLTPPHAFSISCRLYVHFCTLLSWLKLSTFFYNFTPACTSSCWFLLHSTSLPSSCDITPPPLSSLLHWPPIRLPHASFTFTPRAHILTPPHVTTTLSYPHSPAPVGVISADTISASYRSHDQDAEELEAKNVRIKPFSALISLWIYCECYQIILFSLDKF